MSSAPSNWNAVSQAIVRPLTPAQVALMPSGSSTSVASEVPAGSFTPGAIVTYTPAQIRQAYGVDQLSQNGTGQTIAIVDAYDLTTAAVTNNLATFDAQFGLPAPPSLTVVTPGGSNPPTNSGWDWEIMLDVEWAHAIAPGAKILLEEAASATDTSLLGAVSDAVSRGANQVSMSWGGSEFSNEVPDNSYFNHPGVTFLAASGDTASQVLFPAVSPYVTSVGGTTLTLDSSNNVVSESAWSSGGGGPSTLIGLPSFQSGFFNSSYRGTPDVAYNADPNTGVYVYNSGWGSVGGTSAGAPQWAGLVALANQGRVAAGEATLGTGQAYGTNSVLYQLAGGTSYTNPNGDFTDITTGSNGHPAAVGYDLATGLGTPVANRLIPNLIGPAQTGSTPTIGDAGFEAVSVGAGNFAYDPTGSAWAFAGSAGVSGINSGFSAGNGPAPQGGQVAFLQQYGTISQSVAGWAAGSYTISFDAAQRGNQPGSAEDFEVLVDGTPVGTFKPSGVSYQAYTTASFAVSAGSHTVEFLGLDSAGGDNTAMLDAITVAVGSGSGSGSSGTPTVGDYGFEAVPVGAGNFAYDPTGSAWAFAGSAGISGVNSGFSAGNGPAPQGGQVAFLQQYGTISQSVAGWAAGSYTISFDAAQRGNQPGSAEDFEVLVDGTPVGTFKPSGVSYQAYTTASFAVSAGSHTVEFLGLDSAGGDNTAMLDDVTVAKA